MTSIPRPPPVLEKLFPYCCVVDGDGRLVAVSRRLERFVPPDGLGAPLRDWFQIESPPGIGVGLHDFDGSLVAATHRTSALTFRGQVVADVDGFAATDVVLAWSPWLTSMADFARFELTLADFGAHDSTIDVLHLLQATQSAQRDAVAPLRRLQRFFNLADSALLVLDRDGLIRQANESCRLALAGAAGSVTGRELAEFAVGDGPDLLRQALAAVVRPGEPTRRISCDLRHADGVVRHYRIAIVGDVTASDDGDAHGVDPVSVYAIARDVTDEEEHRRATELVLDGAPIAMLVATSDGVITYANEATCRLFGYRSMTLVGSPVELLLPPELRDAHVAQRADLVGLTGLPSIRVMGESRRVVGLTALGELVELDITLTFVTIGGSRHVVASILDVRSQKALERQLRQARDSAIALAEAKSAVLANTSHEIRTPLTSVLGLADLLLDTELSDDQRDMVATMRTAGNRLLELVNDILTLARAESGRLAMDVVVFSPGELAAECAQIVSPQTSGSAVALHLSVDPATPARVQGDPEKIRGVLLNLLGNAVKFTLAGEVRLEVEPADAGYVVFRVSDTGIGIADDDVAKLFEPFVQADNTSTRKFGGSGLGLAIADQLVRMMGGSIEVSSVLGQGSTFLVHLPLPIPDEAVRADAEARSTTHAPAEESPSTHERSPRSAAPAPRRPQDMTVLLVEDDRINSEILRRMLTKAGTTVVQAYDGNAALVKLREQDYDLVLMDCHMPGMDGLEATRRIRAGEAGAPDIRVVALTAAALDEDRRRCLAAGMDDFLTKPVRLDDIANVLTRPGSAVARPAT